MHSESASERLPRGPHGLTREEVAQSQRGRILRAMTELMAHHGYAATSVAEVARRARVSRESFYEQFSSKEDCFMSAFETAVEIVFASALESAAAADGDPLERFGRAARAYLDTLAEHPALARLFLVEVYAAGPAALQRRTLLQQRFAAALNEMLGARNAADRFAVEALIAATSAMVTARLTAGDLDGIRALHGPLLELVRRVHASRG